MNDENGAMIRRSLLLVTLFLSTHGMGAPTEHGVKELGSEEGNAKGVTYTAKEEDRLNRGKSAEFAPEMPSHGPESPTQEATADSVSRQGVDAPGRPGNERDEKLHEKRLVAEHQVLYKDFLESNRAYHGSTRLYHAAEEPVYPGNGRMHADDVKAMMGDVARTRKSMKMQAAEHEKMNKAMEEVESDKEKLVSCSGCRDGDVCASKCKTIIADLTDKIKAAMQDSSVEFQLNFQLTAAKSELKRCEAKLLSCIKNDGIKSEPTFDDLDAPVEGVGVDLGEAHDLGRDDTYAHLSEQPVKHTGPQEDKQMRGEHDPVAEVTAKPVTQHVARTEMQQYAYDQRMKAPWSFMDGEPGMKLPHDKMTAAEISDYAGDGLRMIERAQQMQKEEDAIDDAKLKAALDKTVQTAQVATLAQLQYKEKLKRATDIRYLNKGSGPIEDLGMTRGKLMSCLREQQRKDC